jgi:UDP-N-acetylglucosamine transferase subunit ALG13
VILVTLGTHAAPMDRLADAVDALVRDGIVGRTEEIVFQAAAVRLRPRHATTVEVVAFETLAAWLRGARVVICHAGPGTILQAIASGRRPIVVPRDPRFGEHVDDHQLRFARWLAARRPLDVVEDVRWLPRAVQGAEAPEPAWGAAPSSVDRVAERLSAIVG